MSRFTTSKPKHAKPVRKGPAVRAVLTTLTVLLGMLSIPTVAQAATVPTGFTHTTIASGLTTPTAMALLPDGRIFVSEKQGTLRVIKNGVLNATPFVTETVDGEGERGLLGVTYDPDFATNHYIYLYYTATTPTTHNRVARFTADGDVAQKKADGTVDETTILDLPTLPTTAKIHNSGALHFGPDGKLYISVGDASIGSNAQSLTTLFGKILRINSDGTIPADNPFFSQTTGQNRAIWAMGLRNPFTFDFETGTGKMMINDVGAEAWEEIDEGVAGANYGWPTTEGPTTDPRFKAPLFAYKHSQSGGQTPNACAITGGSWYNPTNPQFPSEYQGQYFFGDFCGQWIKRLNPATGQITDFVNQASVHPVDERLGADGNLYYLALGPGTVVRVGYNGAVAPTIGDNPDDTLAGVGEDATFNVSATGSGLTYQWVRDGSNVPGATSPSYTLNNVQLSDDGAQLKVVVTNSKGSATSTTATLHVTTDQKPVPVIDTPDPSLTWNGGDPIAYSGHAEDPEDGDEPADNFTWQVDLQHDTHAHPYIAAFSGTKASMFNADPIGHTESNIWFRIYLTVTDSEGRSATTSRDIYPNKMNLSLATVPAGLSVNLDDQPRTTPLTLTAVVGVDRKLTAPAQQTLNGVTYQFVSWSDGGDADHTIDTPSTDTTYTATYKVAAGVTKVSPIADSYANEGAPTKNFGTSNELAARDTSPGQTSYLRFALPAAPAGQVLQGASLRIRTSSESFAGTADRVYVHPADDGWSETGLTWNNRPAVSASQLGTFAPGTTPGGTYDAQLDPAMVSSLLGGTHSIALQTEGSDNIYFWSREQSTTTYRPTLSLVFGDDDGTPPPPPDTEAPTIPGNVSAVASGSTANVNWDPAVDNVDVLAYDIYRSTASDFVPSSATKVGSTGGTTYNDTGVPAGSYFYKVVARDAAGNVSPASDPASVTITATAPVTMTLSPVADSYGNQGAASTNYGTAINLAAHGVSPGQTAYLRFTLPAAPAGKTLTGVVLKARTTSDSFAGSAQTTAVRLANDGWTEAGLTWNNKPALGAALGSFPATAVNTPTSATLSASLLAGLTGSVSIAVAPAADDSFWFYSRNYSTVASRPTLVLTYS